MTDNKTLHDIALRRDHARDAVARQQNTVDRLAARGKDVTAAYMVLTQIQTTLQAYEAEYHAHFARWIKGEPASAT